MLGVQLTHAHQIAAHMGRLWKQYEEALGEVGITHITARQELREMISGLGIPSADEVEQKVA